MIFRRSANTALMKTSKQVEIHICTCTACAQAVMSAPLVLMHCLSICNLHNTLTRTFMTMFRRSIGNALTMLVTFLK